MSKFKVKYRDRNRLAASLRKVLRRMGLVDTNALIDSVRISFEQEKGFTGGVPRRSDLKLRLTINSMYYYLFLDEGASLWNGGVIAPMDITEEWLGDSSTREVLEKVARDFIVYTHEQTGRILQLPSPTIEVWLNPIGGSGEWSEPVQLRARA